MVEDFFNYVKIHIMNSKLSSIILVSMLFFASNAYAGNYFGINLCKNINESEVEKFASKNGGIFKHKATEFQDHTIFFVENIKILDENLKFYLYTYRGKVYNITIPHIRIPSEFLNAFAAKYPKSSNGNDSESYFSLDYNGLKEDPSLRISLIINRKENNAALHYICSDQYIIAKKAESEFRKQEQKNKKEIDLDNSKRANF